MHTQIDTVLMYFFNITFNTIAVKEFAFMKALHAHGFPTPTPIDQSRHIVAMSKIEGGLVESFMTIHTISLNSFLQATSPLMLPSFLVYCADSDDFIFTS